jgi:chitodextrinase
VITNHSLLTTTGQTKQHLVSLASNTKWSTTIPAKEPHHNWRKVVALFGLNTRWGWDGEMQDRRCSTSSAKLKRGH